MAHGQTLDAAQKQDVTYCIPLWLRDEQVKAATALPIGRMQPVPVPRPERVAVVNYGPSLADTWEQIKEFEYVITCSGAHKFLVERGIIPTWHVEVDPRAHKVDLIGPPQDGTEYLIASTCHRAVFEHLAGKKVLLWHVFDSAEEGIRVLPPGEWAVTGGCSVGLRALTIAGFLGFRDLHVFGMDGCEGATGKHAAAHPSQPKGHAVTVYNGVEYRTTPSMLAAAQQTWHELNQMPAVRATFYGEGLVQAMAKDYVPKPKNSAKAFQNIIGFVKPSLISAEYADLNRRLHRDNLAYGVGGGKHAETVLKLCSGMGSTSVLDYGCQPLDAKVLTPVGWKAMGDVVVGDYVVGASGRPVRVIGTHRPGIADLYRVSFTDGTSLTVDGGHLWATRTSNHQKRGQPFHVKATRDFLGDLTWPNAAPLKWRIPMVAPIEFWDRADRPVHPYLLGVLLGDGALNGGCASLSAGNPAVVAATAEALPAGTMLQRQSGRGDSRAGYSVVKISRRHGPRAERANPVTVALKSLGVWGKRAWEKAIPDCYLFAPADERVALLQGLMDTDGEVRRHHLSYSSTSLVLAQQVAFLAQSLGGTAHVVERKRSVYTHNGERRTHARASYVVHLKVPPTIRPTRAKPWTPPIEYMPNRIIASVESVGTAEVGGIEVAASDGLYVTEGCIVTHNCGKGYLAKALPFPIWEYDPAIPGKEATPRPADLVVCSDVLEHIEPEKLDVVLEDLRRCTRKVGYFVIHTGAASKTLPENGTKYGGHNTHLIQRGKAWWDQHLRRYFTVGKIIERGSELHAIVGPKTSKPKRKK